LQSRLGQPHLTRVLEKTRIRALRDTIFVIAIERLRGAGCIGLGKNAVSFVEMNPAMARCPRVRIDDEQLVGAVAADVAVRDGARRIQVGHSFIPVVDEAAGGSGIIGVEAVERIVAKGRASGT
jgi:hypothetical protein